MISYGVSIIIYKPLERLNSQEQNRQLKEQLDYFIEGCFGMDCEINYNEQNDTIMIFCDVDGTLNTLHNYNDYLINNAPQLKNRLDLIIPGVSLCIGLRMSADF